MINSFTKRLESIKEFVTNIIYDSLKGPTISFCDAIVKFLACVFNFCIQLCLIFFKNFIFKIRCLLVALGRLTVGGSLKTPIVETFGRRINQRDCKVAILSGGYKNKPYPLILDDSFQYLCVKGRLNLLVIDKTNSFRSGQRLPRRILREPMQHLKRFILDKIHDFYIEAQQQGYQLVVTTEKEAVRFSRNISTVLLTFFFRLEINILKGNNDFRKAVSKLCFPKNKMRATRPMVRI